MIRYQFVFVLILTFLLPLSLSKVYGQSEISTPNNWNHLLVEYRLLKGSLKIFDDQIMNLQKSLSEARKLQESSEKEISSLKGSLTEANKLQENLSNIIADLETQLQRAIDHRKILQDRISQLENELIRLTLSLENMKSEIRENEKKHETMIFDLVTEYENQQSSLEFQRNVAIGVIIVETVALAVLSYLAFK